MKAKDKKQLKIGIIGAGVSGLTCGIKLLQEGYSNIEIFAKELSPHTTSDVAPALWRPYRMMPEALAVSWALESLKVFKKLIKESDSGVSWLNLTEVYRHLRKKPGWMYEVKSAPTPYIPKEYHCSYSVYIPLIDTSIYMRYLMNTFTQLGGIITTRKIQQLKELKNYPYIINCCGIGARQLLRDKQVFPIKGQVIRMSKPKALNYGIVEYEKQMTYIYPRQNDCIIGSTMEENQWELSSDKDEAKNIIKRAKKLCPLIQDAEILEYKAGLRPARNEIRCDAEPLSMDSIVIHNYGHGGRGFTLSWGCANQVVNLLNEYFLGEES